MTTAPHVHHDPKDPPALESPPHRATPAKPSHPPTETAPEQPQPTPNRTPTNSHAKSRLGTIFYILARQLVEVLLGSDTTAALGITINQFPAQIGVCWVFWMILWANAFGNRPTGLNMAVNYAIRTALTLALAVVSFIFYYRFAAEHILHEAAVAPGINGNALGFVDWMVLMTLLYVVGFESLGLRRLMKDDPTVATL
ncbi:hypothetical protein [Candidatus Mycolicibacterium alkanivorans]|uniref:hypothetical protein n=1 Tax=Candidatus Mycolicibacterium alkanivorans TaxID=2954114 RepID=UPI003555BFDC